VSLPILTDLLVVREFADGDAAELARAFQSPEVLWWDPAPFTHERARAWIARARVGYARSGCGLYAVGLRDDGRLLGDCGLVVRTVEREELVEIGWHLERGAWGRGYATEAARAVLLHAESLGVRRVCSLIVPVNARSARVAEKLGMRVERQVVHAGMAHDLWALDVGQADAREEVRP
jgi:RimJ/RimL family protein N-acetyltransferase